MPIYPKCKLKSNQVLAIRYDGYVTPCCHFGSDAHYEIRELLGDSLEQTHITYSSIDEINSSEAFQMIERSFTTNPLPQCVRMCSDPDNLSGNKTSANADFAVVGLNNTTT
jgi:hypothetical protein